eukprot:5512716-Pleurochrysis_carterae.AAC.1
MALRNGRERSTGSRELLRGPAELQVMNECEEGDKVIRGLQGRRKGEVDKLWHRASRDRHGEDRCVDEGERVEHCRAEDGREGRT